MRTLQGFPEVEVDLNPSFATSVGSFTEVAEVRVGGEARPRSEILSAMIARRGGWSADGDSGDASIKNTFTAYVDAWTQLLEHDALVDETIPDDLAELLDHPLTAPKPRPDYHPRRVSLHELAGGERAVVGTWFERMHVGEYGREWRYVVWVHRTADGAPVSLGDQQAAAASPPIPRPRHFTSMPTS